MSNRVTKEVLWTKKEAREKVRGEYVKHCYKYIDDEGMEKTIGLVIWKDRQPVYILTSECNTSLVDKCVRRSKGGLLYIDRPIAVAQYNQFMGGVDVADMKRLFCESRVHGLNRWWIRIFLYHMDVGTVNAMVLFRNSYTIHKEKPEARNLRNFKLSWIEEYCGSRIRSIPNSPIGLLPQCYLVPMTRRNRCAWCNSMSDTRMDTKMACNSCTTGEGPVYFCNPAQRPCFFLAHNDPGTKQMIIDYESQFKRKRKRNTLATTNSNDTTIYSSRSTCVQLAHYM